MVLLFDKNTCLSNILSLDVP